MAQSDSFTQTSRRNFLKSSSSLLVTFSLLGGAAIAETDLLSAERLPGSLRHTPQLNAWLEVLEDGRVRICSGKVELGQGIRIAIKQVAAEELYMDLNQVEVVLADTERTPNEGYTAGSGSVQNSAMAVRHAAAYARQRLLQMAASQLQLPVNELSIIQGKIKGPDTHSSLSFADVLEGKQLEEEVSWPIELKPKWEYQYVGKSIKREDVGGMVQGKGMFIEDLRFPGMLHARVLRPKNYQSKLLEFDQTGFEKAAPWVLKTHRDGNFIGIIAPSTFEVEKGIRILAQYTEWSRPAFLPKDSELKTYIRKIAAPPKRVKETGSIKKWDEKNTYQASYSKPYIMHASLGTACAVAKYENEVLSVWTSSQGIYPLREALRGMLNMEAERIHLISVPGPGCFGHTVADDAAADAALLAIAHPGQHLMVQWSREDDHAWEPFGSAMCIDLTASLDASGKIDKWKTDVWSDSQSTRPNRDAGTLLPARHLAQPIPMKGRGYLNGAHRNADPYYDIPHMQVDAHFMDGPLRVSSLRSLAAFGNAFAIESFMDELAAKAGKSPIEFRLAHLSDPRAKAVLEKVADMSKNQKIGAEQGIGYAFCRYKNNAAYCAVAAHVEVKAKQIRLIKLWAAVDVGEVINPDGLRNQTEGGLIQAASWTLKEAVRFQETGIVSTSFGSYPSVRPVDCPEIAVAIIDRPESPAMGAGEASIPPTGAAIANAVFAACGRRIYDLPLRV